MLIRKVKNEYNRDLRFGLRLHVVSRHTQQIVIFLPSCHVIMTLWLVIVHAPVAADVLLFDIKKTDQRQIDSETPVQRCLNAGAALEMLATLRRLLTSVQR